MVFGELSLRKGYSEKLEKLIYLFTGRLSAMRGLFKHLRVTVKQIEITEKQVLKQAAR